MKSIILSRILYNLSFFLIFLFFYGCSTIYQVHTGASDMRFYQAGIQTGNKVSTEGIFFSPKAGQTVIKKNEAIQVTLQRIFIRDFKEVDKKGEIAIVAKIYEDNVIRDQSFEGIRNGRLIYYGEGIAKTGQPLNAIGIPMYGPILYDGNDLVMEFYVIERDEKESQQLATILNVISNLGGKAYPPASPYLDILGQIGSAILASNKDDLVVEYKAAFHPADGQDSLPKLLLQEGNYVLAHKLVDRENPIDWENIVLDKNTGLLQERVTYKDTNGNDQTKYQPFNKLSYLVVQINTAGIMRAKATAEAQTLAQFTLKEEQFLKSNLDILQKNLSGVGKKFDILYKTKTVKSADSNTKEGKAIFSEAIDTIINDLKKAPDKREFSDEQIDTLLNELRIKFPNKLDVLSKSHLSDNNTSLKTVLKGLNLQILY